MNLQEAYLNCGLSCIVFKLMVWLLGENYLIVRLYSFGISVARGQLQSCDSGCRNTSL